MKKNIVTLLTIFLCMVGTASTSFAHAGDHEDIAELEALFSLETMSEDDLWDYIEVTLKMADDIVKTQNADEFNVYLDIMNDAFDELKSRNSSSSSVQQGYSEESIKAN